MVIEVVNEADKGYREYYIIPTEVGKILKKNFGCEIYDPPKTMGSLLYNCYMSLCKGLGDVMVMSPDIIFHLS